MRQTELHLSDEDRIAVDEIRAKGVHHSREVNRAHTLSCLDRGIPESQIMDVLGIGRTAIWRTRAAYLQGGVELAVFDVAALRLGWRHCHTAGLAIRLIIEARLEDVETGGHYRGSNGLGHAGETGSKCCRTGSQLGRRPHAVGQSSIGAGVAAGCKLDLGTDVVLPVRRGAGTQGQSIDRGTVTGGANPRKYGGKDA
jgi:hypothetical protein